MAIPQTPSPLSAIVAAKTYNAQWFSGATKEAQITSAIAAAVTDGALIVSVPANMLPYNGSLVTFNSAVHMQAEGGPTDINVFWTYAYGVPEDGVTDVTTYVQTVENLRAAGQVLKFTYGKTYLLSASTGATVLRTHAAGSWDLSGATLKYGGAGNLTVGSDSAELGLVNILNSPFQIGGLGAILDGNSKCPTPLAILHTQSGIAMLPHLTIQNVLEAQTTSVWSGISYRVSIDVSNVAVTTARALMVHGNLIRPNCPFANASDVITTHGDASALVVGGNIAEVSGVNGVRPCSGFALVNANTAGTGNFNVNFERLGHNGIITGQTIGGVGQLAWMDLGIHDIGPSTMELYGQILPVAFNLTWGASVAVGADTTVKVLVATSNIAAVIGIPSSPPGAANRDMMMKFIIRNNSGGALTTPIVFQGGANAYISSGPVSPASGSYVIVDFVYDQPNNVWVECNRAGSFGPETPLYGSGATVASPAGSPVGIEGFTLPAGVALATTVGFKFRAWGHCANNANAKTVALQLNGSNIVVLPLTVNTANTWYADTTILLKGSLSSQSGGGVIFQGPTTPTFATGQVPLSANFANAVTFFASATVQTSAGDISVDGMVVEFVP